MRHVFTTFLNISLSVSILFLLFKLVDYILKKRYSIRWKHLAFLLLGIRLLLPINLGVITLPMLSLDDSYHKESLTNITLDSNFNDSTTDLINLPSADKEVVNIDSSYPLNSPNDSLLNSNSDKDLQSKNQLKTTDFFSITRLFHSIRDASFNPFITTWLIGAIIFLFYHLSSYVAFHRKVKYTARATDNATYLDIMQEQKNHLHITKDIKLLIYNDINSPLLLGFRNPCILLPNNNYTKDQIAFIIKHELTHYKHHDLYIKLLLIVSNTLHWFNPIIYLLVREASLTMELYCDESVTAKQTLSYREQYSLTLLQIMKSGNSHSPALLSTGFTNYAKHMKERFLHIMNTSTKKKGSILIILSIAIILIGSNLTSGKTEKSSLADTSQNIELEDESTNTSEAAESTKETETITNILILGLDTTGSMSSEYPPRPDSILLLTLNKEKNTATFNTILRDILVDIPGHKKNKISNAYVIGGEELMKTTLNQNFGITIDHSIAVDMSGLENCINLLGGTEVTLTAEEASYLNQTNFISNKSNRNVVEGLQNMNGNQTLGYLRLRYVPTITGETNDYGRTKRLIQVIQSLAQKLSSKDIDQILKIATSILPMIVTDMSREEIIDSLEILLSSSKNMHFTCIPRFEDCTTSNDNGMSVLIPDLEQSRKLFSEYLQ
nr:M56 family metallopeptidase [uncultured Anaerosporobacter sp.]